jgi:hypothetical protein
VGAAPRRINLPQLSFHTSGVLHNVSELMAMCACQSFRSAAWSSRRSSDLARFISRRIRISFILTKDALSLSTAAPGASARWMLWSEDVGLEVVNLS